MVDKEKTIESKLKDGEVFGENRRIGKQGKRNERTRSL